MSFDTADAAAYTLGANTVLTLELNHTSNTAVGAGVVADQTIIARINLGTIANQTQVFNFSNASSEAELILGELVRRASSVGQRRGAEVKVSGNGDVVMGQFRLEGTSATGVMRLFKSGDGTLTLGQGVGDVDNRFTNLESLTAGAVVLNKASSTTVHALAACRI